MQAARAQLAAKHAQVGVCSLHGTMARQGAAVAGHATALPVDIPPRARHPPPVSNSILCTSPRPRGAMRRNSMTCGATRGVWMGGLMWAAAQHSTVATWQLPSLHGHWCVQQAGATRSQAVALCPAGWCGLHEGSLHHTCSPASPLTFTMAPLTDPIQRKSRTLPPSRMYLGASGGCEHRLGQHRGCNNTWIAGHVRHTCQPRTGQPPSAAPSATPPCPAIPTGACPHSPGLGGGGGCLRHVAAVQQLEAHRLAGLLGLTPRVGALRGQGRRGRALRFSGRASAEEWE